MLKLNILIFWKHILVHAHNIYIVQTVDKDLKIMKRYFSLFKEHFALRKYILNKVRKIVVDISYVCIDICVSKSFLPFNNKY